jgi:hypothetical protein
LLVELARGKTIDEALAITDADIEAALDGYPEKKKDYPERSRFALQAAIEDYRAGRAEGRITDAMLEQARGIAAAAAAASRAPGTGTTEEDAKAGPQLLDDGGMLTIKLH